MSEMFGYEVDSLVKMARNVAFVFVHSRDIFIMRDGSDWMFEFIAFSTTHDCSDTMFLIGRILLLRVLRFYAASMLLMYSEPLSG